MKKKIVLISEALGGGVRKHIIDLIENINRDKFEIYFIYNLDRADVSIKDRIPYMKDMGINMIEVENFNREIGINDIKAFSMIYKQLRRIKPDVVHCHSSKAGVLGRISAKLLGVNLIYYTPHAYYFQNSDLSKLKKVIYKFIESVLSRFCTTKTINVSKGEMDEALISKIDKENKFNIIYNGIKNQNDIKYDNKNLLRDELGIKDTDIVIGSIARLNKQKNPYEFFNIAQMVVNKYNNIKFLYVGDGELYDHINNKIHHHKLENNIILTGFRKDIESMLNIFDIFISTSIYEGMPYSLIEATRQGLPIVATNVTGNNEIVKDNYNGILYECGNYKQAYDCIVDLINDEEKRIVMGENSYKIFTETFDLKMMINKLEEIYNQ